MNWEILIVDDEEEILRTLRNFLVLSGYSARTASSGKEALEIMRTTKIHIVLTDVKMPGMDGLELLEEIRKQDFSTQVIIMTGFSTFDIALQALEKGATDYLLKPFESLDEIARMIEISVEKLDRWKKVIAGSSKKSKT